MNNKIDFEQLARFAAEEKAAQNTVPSIGRFLQDLVNANNTNFNEDVESGVFGRLAARVLADYYASTTDVKQPAFDPDYSSDYLSSLNAALTDIDASTIFEALKKKALGLGDPRFTEAAKNLTPEMALNACHFALMRGYVDSYRQYILRNPIAQIIQQNQNNKPNAEEALASDLSFNTIKQAAEKKEESAEEKERRAEGEEKPSSIHEGEGDKIRLSQLVTAYKILRCKKAKELIEKPEDNSILMDYLGIDAQTDYLDLVSRQIKEYIQADEARKFNRWNGQTLGSDDPFVINTGHKATTLNKFFPEAFTLQSSDVAITYKDIRGKERRLQKLDATAFDFFRWQGQVHFSTPEKAYAYNDKFKKNYIEDAKVHRDFLVTSREASESRLTESQIKLLKSAAGAPMDEATVILRGNQIFHQIHTLFSTKIFASDDAEVVARKVNEYNVAISKAIVGKPPFSESKAPDKNESIAKLVKSVFDDFQATSQNAVAWNMFAGKTVANMFKHPVTVDEALVGLPAEVIEKIRAEVKELIVARTTELDQKLKYDGKEPRDPQLYSAQVVTAALNKELNAKYQALLPRNEATGKIAGKYAQAINNAVKSIATELYPDTYGVLPFKARLTTYRDKKAVEDLKGVLATPYFQLPSVQKEFEEEQNKYSFGAMSNWIAEPIKAGVAIIESNPTPLRIPVNPSQHSLAVTEAYIQQRFGKYNAKNQDYVSQKKALYEANLTNIAWSLDMRDYLFALRIPTVELDEALKQGMEQDHYVRKLLDDAYPDAERPVDTRSFYVYVANLLNQRLRDVVADGIVDKFQAARMWSGGDSAMVSRLDRDAESARARVEFEGTEEAKIPSKELEFREEIASHFEEFKGMFDEYQEVGDVGEEGVPRARMTDEEIQAMKRDVSLAEAYKYLDRYASSEEELFKIGRTKRTAHEKEGDPRRMYDISSTTIGGSLKQLMGYSRSSTLDDKFISEKPMAFLDFWRASNAMGFGGAINRFAQDDLSVMLEGAPDGEPKTRAQLMQTVKCFAQPFWAITRWSKAFQTLEHTKLENNINKDENDTAEKAFDRAIYYCQPIDAGIKTRLISYFENAKTQFMNGLKLMAPVNESMVEKYLIMYFKDLPGVSLIDNPTNDPYSQMSPNDLGYLLEKCNITVNHLEKFFSDVKQQNEILEKRGVGLGVPDHSTPERSMRTKMKIARDVAELREWNVDSFDGAKNLLLKAVFPVENQNLGKEAIAVLFKSLHDKIGQNAGLYLTVFKTAESFAKEATDLLNAMPDRFDPVKPAILLLLNKSVNKNLRLAKNDGVSPDTPMVTEEMAKTDLSRARKPKASKDKKKEKPKALQENIPSSKVEEEAKKFTNEVVPEKPTGAKGPKAPTAPVAPTAPTSPFSFATPKEAGAKLLQIVSEKLTEAEKIPQLTKAVPGAKRNARQIKDMIDKINPDEFSKPKVKDGIAIYIEKCMKATPVDIVTKMFRQSDVMEFFNALNTLLQIAKTTSLNNDRFYRF